MDGEVGGETEFAEQLLGFLILDVFLLPDAQPLKPDVSFPRA